jgi:tRNA pseudouridine55 synthase
MYSAVKRNGVPLYKLARKGVIVEREPRGYGIFSRHLRRAARCPVHGSLFEGLTSALICHDLEKPSAGAHMTELRRTGVRRFFDRRALSPESPATELEGRVIPLEDALKRGDRAAFEVLSAPV